MDQEPEPRQKNSKKKSWVGGVVFAGVVIIVVIIALTGRDGSEGGTAGDVETGVVKEDNRVGDGGEAVGNSVGELAPDFVVVDYEGNEVRLTDFAGRPVLLNFWATWCPFCVDELPLFARAQKDADNAFVTLAVNRAEKIERAQSYRDRLGVTADLAFVVDNSDRVYSRYGGFSMPVSIFIDSTGIIRDIKQGPLTESELRQRLTKILPEAEISESN